MIEFQGVVKQFGERVILNEISFKINKGEIVFILGMSGTGKSVTLKNLVGLLKPEKGKIIIDGEEISGYSEEEMFPIRKKCGMVFQHPALFDSLSVFENIAFGLRRLEKMNEDQVRERVLDCLRLVNLADISKKMPNEISYGMQKRVSLARTLALRPQVLLFDEPTTGLDPITTNAINKLIKDLSDELKTTSLVVSHDMHCALDIADRIIVLESGKILEQGTPDELIKSDVPLVKDFLQEALEVRWGQSTM